MCLGQNVANWKHPLHPLKVKALKVLSCWESCVGSDQEPTRLLLWRRILTTAGNTIYALVTSAVVTTALLQSGYCASSARFCAKKVTRDIVPILRMRKLRLKEANCLRLCNE